MKIQHLTIEGLKGDRRVEVDLSGPLLVVGRNGAGKSRIADALDFVLGRRVAGVATDAAQLRSAVGRSGACVSIRVIDDSGREHVVTRRRDIDAKSGTFGRSVLTIDGATAKDEALAALLGDVSQPAGESWLSMSPEQIAASLARIGAASDSGAKRIDDIRARVQGVLGDETPKASDPVAWLTEARDKVKAATNKAKSDAAAAEKSAEQSRVEAAVENVTPERMRGLEAARDDAQRALDAATRRRADVQADAQVSAQRRADAKRVVDAASAAVAQARYEHDREIEALRSAEAALAQVAGSQVAGDPGAQVTALRSEVAEVERTVAAAKAARQDAQHAITSAEDLSRNRSLATVSANDALKRAREQAEHIAGGRCPTCTQAVGPEVLGTFEAAVATAEQDLDACGRMLTESIEYIVECESARDEATAYLEDCEAGLCDARNRLHAAELAAAQNADARIATLQARVEAARAAADKAAQRVLDAAHAAASVQAQHASILSATDDHGAQFAALGLDVERAAQAHQAAQTAVDGARMAAARHLRWREDLARRDAAKARKEAVDTAMDAIRSAESALAEIGFDAIRRDADIPEHVGSMRYVDGAIGLQDVHGALVSGAGLSGAQRTMLAHAIDHGLDDVTGRACRVVTLEADPLDREAMRAALAELAIRYASGELAAVVVTTCHAVPESDRPRLFRVLDMGDAERAENHAPQDSDPTPEATPAALATQAAVQVAEPAADAFLPLALDEDDPSAGCPDCEEACDHGRGDCAPSVPMAHPSPAGTPTPDPTHVEPTRAQPPTPAATTEQPSLFGAQAPAWLTKPGNIMAGGGPVDALKDAARTALDGLSTGALEYMTEWGGRGAVPDPRPEAVSHAVVNELIEAQILTEDPFDCRLTPGGEWAWRILHDVEPVRSDAQAARDDRIAPDGAGATPAEIEGALKRGALSVEALRYLGLTRGGLDTATKRSSGIWRRHIVQVFHRRGFTLEFVERWIAEAAEKHPKKARTGAPDAGDTDNDTDE